MSGAIRKNSGKQKQLSFKDLHAARHLAKNLKPALGDRLANRVPRIPKRRRIKSLRGQL
jgi:hypothetical protein